MIYILQFNPPMHHARYYVGYADDGHTFERIEQHRKGQGAAITRAAVSKGIELKLVTIFPGDRRLERQIKRMKNTPKLVARIEQKGWRACPNYSLARP